MCVCIDTHTHSIHSNIQYTQNIKKDIKEIILKKKEKEKKKKKKSNFFVREFKLQNMKCSLESNSAIN